MAVHVHQSCCCAGSGGAPQAASAADPGTTLPSIPAFAHAAQGPAPVFAFGPAGADMYAGPPACDEAPEAQDAGMITAERVCACPVLHAQPRVIWLASMSPLTRKMYAPIT